MATEPDRTASTQFFEMLDRAKGILIVLIVFAHNTLVTQSWPEVRSFLYNWHVFAFLLLALMMPFHSDKPGFLTTRFIRYYVPFTVFFTLTWAAMIVLDGKIDGLANHFSEWAVAVVIGSAALLDQASGARLFWFLPALMGLVLIRWAIDRLPDVARLPTLAIIALSGFLMAGLIPDGLKPWLPFGIPIALYAIGPGLVFAFVIKRCIQSVQTISMLWLCAGLSAVLCAMLYGYTSYRGSSLVLASFNFFDVRTPELLVAHALLAMTGAAGIVFAAAAMGQSRPLQWLGQSSLLIYLVHQIIFVGLRAVTFRIMPDLDGSAKQIAAIATFAVTMLLSIAVAWIIQSSATLRRLVAPRDWKDWCAGLGSVLPRKA